MCFADVAKVWESLRGGLWPRMKIKEAAGQGQLLHLFTQTAIIHYHLSVSAEILLPQHC